MKPAWSSLIDKRWKHNCYASFDDVVSIAALDIKISSYEKVNQVIGSTPVFSFNSAFAIIVSRVHSPQKQQVELAITWFWKGPAADS